MPEYILDNDRKIVAVILGSKRWNNASLLLIFLVLGLLRRMNNCSVFQHYRGAGIITACLDSQNCAFSLNGESAQAIITSPCPQ